MTDMIERMGRRLVSAFERPGGPDGDVAQPPVPLGRIIEFLAYGDDSLLMGRLRLDGDRLTDQLNAQDEYEIVDLVVERLSDGHAAESSTLLVARHELLLVRADGPRGHPDRRQRTRAYPVAVQVGPYRVRGQLHAMPGVDPEVVIHRRAPMVPLTEAWVERQVGAEWDEHRIGTVVLNRDRMDWVVATWDDSSRWIERERDASESTAPG
jgi:hypothetical protein